MSSLYNIPYKLHNYTMYMYSLLLQNYLTNFSLKAIWENNHGIVFKMKTMSYQAHGLNNESIQVTAALQGCATHFLSSGVSWGQAPPSPLGGSHAWCRAREKAMIFFVFSRRKYKENFWGRFLYNLVTKLFTWETENPLAKEIIIIDSRQGSSVAQWLGCLP